MEWKLIFRILCFCMPSFLFCISFPRESTSPYLMQSEHPAKPILDKIFSNSRAILNVKSMIEAGFVDPYPRKFTRLIVTKHPSLQGFIIKTYLDAQRYHKNQPEHHHWILRIQGAQAIFNFIEERGWHEHFKVPNQWIYSLPENPSPPEEFLAKQYILIEEDMQLYPDKDNKALWASDYVSPELLNQLYDLLNDLGLHDCVSIDNIPFSVDGRIAFVDTQTFYEWPLDYDKLGARLSKEMQHYWKQLILNKKKKKQRSASCFVK